MTEQNTTSVTTRHELQRLNPRHYQIMDLLLAGHKVKDIAQALDITPQSVSLVTNSPLFQHELEKRRSTITTMSNEQLALTPSRAKQVLDAASVRAAETHVELLENEDPRIRQKSADSILEKVLRSNDAAPTIVLEEGAILLLQTAMKEARE